MAKEERLFSIFIRIRTIFLLPPGESDAVSLGPFRNRALYC